MKPAQILTVLRLAASLLPLVIMAVREGRIKSEAQDEVLGQLLSLHSERVWEARKKADLLKKEGTKRWQRD